MISPEQTELIVSLVDLHSRTNDQQLSMKLKILINNIMDTMIISEVKHELEN
jgi:hypothetical protein